MSQSIAAVLLLHQWIERQAMPDALAWLDERVISLSTEPLSNFTASFAKIARRLGKAALDLTDEDTREAYEKCDGWQAEGLTIDQAGRILLIVEAASVQPAEIFQQRLKSLLTTADVGERIAIYRGLPLYPASEAVVGIALDGLRTSVEAIFESIAHRNCFQRAIFLSPPGTKWFSRRSLSAVGLIQLSDWTPAGTAILLVCYSTTLTSDVQPGASYHRNCGEALAGLRMNAVLRISKRCWLVTTRPVSMPRHLH